MSGRRRALRLFNDLLAANPVFLLSLAVAALAAGMMIGVFL